MPRSNLKLAVLSSAALTLSLTAATASERRRPLAQSPSPQGDLRELPADDARQLEEINRRLHDPRYANLFSSAMWTLTHDYKDIKVVEALMADLQSFTSASAKGDPDALKKIGGVRGFKTKLAEYIDNDDDTVRATAAIMLGIFGNQDDVPAVAKLLKGGAREPSSEEVHIPFARGRAALALAMLGAKEYTPSFVELLKSKNGYDQTGAIYALSWLGVKSEAGAIAAVLSVPDMDVFLDEQVQIAAMQTLAEMGAREYAPLIAKQLDVIGFEAREAAIYALVRLTGREYVKEIAKLLTDKSTAQAASIALGLLGASEYAKDVAQLLRNGDSLDRKAALLSLGMMRADEYAPLVAGHLHDKEGFVRTYAAHALVLMEARAYARSVVAEIETLPNGLITDLEIPELFVEERQQLKERLEKSYRLMKEARSQQGRGRV